MFGATEEDEMERRRWSADDMAKLQSMAGKYPAKHIAAELVRGISATMDPGAAGFDLPTH